MAEHSQEPIAGKKKYSPSPALGEERGRRGRGQSIEGDRLHKRIAASGLCSRRAAEALIREGRVQVNGQVVTEMGVKVSRNEQVRVDGHEIGTAKSTTLLMNKPLGYLTTLSDTQKRPNVTDLLPDLDVI